MAAKKLHLVKSDPPLNPAPPRKLGPHGSALWLSISAEYAIEDSGGRELLASACQALDRAESCRAHIDREGETIRLKGGLLKEHPLLRTELANRAFVTRCIGRLGLDVEPVGRVGRPTRFPGVS